MGWSNTMQLLFSKLMNDGFQWKNLHHVVLQLSAWAQSASASSAGEKWRHTSINPTARKQRHLAPRWRLWSFMIVLEFELFGQKLFHTHKLRFNCISFSLQTFRLKQHHHTLSICLSDCSFHCCSSRLSSTSPLGYWLLHLTEFYSIWQTSFWCINISNCTQVPPLHISMPGFDCDPLFTSHNSKYFLIVLLSDCHITANEHNSSHSNIMYRKILNRLQYVQYENMHKEIKWLTKIKKRDKRKRYEAIIQIAQKIHESFWLQIRGIMSSTLMHFTDVFDHFLPSHCLHACLLVIYNKILHR